MGPSRRSFALSSVFVVALATGCAGPPIPSPIEGEPVCADVTLGAARSEMVGGLHYPVRMRILDGKSPIMKLILGGRRTATDAPARTLVADDSAEYTVEWAQCPNERAPRPTDKGPKPKDPRAAEKSARALDSGSASYECGDAVVYKTVPLVTKKGEPASHAVKFEAPPNAECWQSDAPLPAPTVVAPPPDAAPAASASAAPAASASAAPAASASAAPAASASAAPMK